MSESVVLFNGEYNKQIDGVAIGSPLGPTLAFIFLSSHEEIWLENGPCEYKPLIYKRYVDDMLIEIILKNFYVTLIANILILSSHSNIKFTFKIEENNSISFLDIEIRRLNNSVFTTIYHKATFSGGLRNFESIF